MVSRVLEAGEKALNAGKLEVLVVANPQRGGQRVFALSCFEESDQGDAGGEAFVAHDCCYKGTKHHSKWAQRAPD